mgnify:CR=1 FL=1
MHTCPLRSGPLRFASFGAHGCVHACFATHARSILTRGYSCPLKPQIGQTFFLRGQPPLIVSARLLVARANRAVTVFASFSSLVPTLSIVCAVCSSFAPPHSSVTLIRFTQHPFFIPGQEPSFAHSATFRSVHFAVEESPAIFAARNSILSLFPRFHLQSLLKRQFSTLHFSQSLIQALAFPGTSSVCKKLRQPCRTRQHSAALTSLRASCCLRPRSTRLRLAPLPSASLKKALRFVPLLFHSPSVGSRLHYLLCFHFALTQPPTTHP